MTQIWKYTLDPANGIRTTGGVKAPKPLFSFEFETRGIPKTLSAQTQFGHPTVWAVVDVTAPLSAICFEVYGTGHDCDLDRLVLFIDTCQLPSGLVVHVFQRLF